MNDANSNEPINLNNAPPDDWGLFANEYELADNGTETPATDVLAQQPAKTEVQAPMSEQIQPAAISDEIPGDVDDTAPAESDDPPANATNAAKSKEAGKAKPSYNEKLPVFDFAGALEDIEDTSQTFDDLRIAKDADFPDNMGMARVCSQSAYALGSNTESLPN